MQSQKTDETPQSRTRRLLIVEDDLETRTFLVMALGEIYEIVEAESAAEALIEVGRQRIDLFLVDIALRDEIDGVALVQILRQNGALQKTPMVAMTAHHMREDRQFYLDHGFTDFIAKPFYPQDLLNLIAGHLTNHLTSSDTL
ncbi:MAG: response regulator [Bradymonadaceae bacterium]|nr:response regulator [Lujinxingiaceae bacterium]